MASFIYICENTTFKCRIWLSKYHTKNLLTKTAGRESSLNHDIPWRIMKIEVIARKRIANTTWKASHICKYIEENLFLSGFATRGYLQVPREKGRKKKGHQIWYTLCGATCWCVIVTLNWASKEMSFWGWSYTLWAWSWQHSECSLWAFACPQLPLNSETAFDFVWCRSNEATLQCASQQEPNCICSQSPSHWGLVPSLRLRSIKE